MSIIGYDPYTNRSTTGGPVDGESSIQIPQCELVKMVELSKEAIGQIAEAVAEKLAAKMEPLKAPQLKNGKWLYKSEMGWGDTWICSECSEKTTSTVMGKPRYKFCPMCGAYMGGKNGND